MTVKKKSMESKRIKELKKITKAKTLSCHEAISLVKKLSNAKFLESIEAHIALNIDQRHSNQQVKTSLILPHGNGNELKIAVLTENAAEALSMGANIAGFDDLLDNISLGNIHFDVLITSPNLMTKITKFGKILGPKGLMPSPKSGTITTNLKATIDEFKLGRVEYKADKGGVVHLAFGKSSFMENQLYENLKAVYQSIEKSKPNGVKGKYVKSFYLCSTMSPSIKVEASSIK